MMKLDPNKIQGIDYDEKTLEKLEDLRNWVENINKAPDLMLRGGIYRGIDNSQIFSTKFDGFEIGYQLEDMGGYMKRRVYIKIPGEDIGNIPDDQIEPVAFSVMDVFFDKGQTEPEIGRVARDCIEITQDFVPVYLVEKNPNIIVPGSRK